MFKFFLFTILLLSFELYANDNLLTVQQQIERLQREVNDLSKLVYTNSGNSESTNNNLSNFSAIDMRIRDLEKDISNLNSNLDDLSIQIQDITKLVNDFENSIEFINMDISNIKNQSKLIDSLQDESIQQNIEINDVDDQNTLGTLKITTSENSSEEDIDQIDNDISNLENNDLSPEDKFQKAMDSMREKKYSQAKELFKQFIKDNETNQLAGSAYYWLGKLQILEKNYRESVITLAEGHEKYPKSIKAPDMLFDLSQSLVQIDKKNEACNIMKILIETYPTNKIVNKTNKLMSDYDCFE